MFFDEVYYSAFIFLVNLVLQVFCLKHLFVAFRSMFDTVKDVSLSLLSALSLCYFSDDIWLLAFYKKLCFLLLFISLLFKTDESFQYQLCLNISCIRLRSYENQLYAALSLREFGFKTARSALLMDMFVNLA